MCGIAGLICHRNGEQPSGDLLSRMASLMVHRGPDEGGIHVQGAVGLAHRRLSIIDLSSGKQPMTSPGGEITVVFNGEIYNFLELREELGKKDHSFRTSSDTEVLLAAYREWGVECLKRLNGMFAFALWDETERHLFAARDRIGKKPFYYCQSERFFIFSSEIKGILCQPEVSREIDPLAVDEFLTYGYIPAPRTIFRDVKKLSPASFLILKDAELRVGRYWELSFDGAAVEADERVYVEKLDQILRQAVKRRMISDVPLGAFLSGGIDSSAIVGLMAQLSSEPVKTFTVGFEEARYSEIEDARLVAEHFGTDHHEDIVRPSAFEILPEIIWLYDEPFGDSSAVPTYYVCKMARQNVTVALAGDGGDELFAGYSRYLTSLSQKSWDRLPGFFRRNVLLPLATIAPWSLPGRNLLYAMGKHLPEAPGWNLGQFPYIKECLYTTEFKSRVQGHDPFESLHRTLSRIQGLDLLSRLQYLDTMNYLPDDILTKVDRASMGHSLEVRAPLLDYEVVEFMATVPSSLKIRNGVTKHLFREYCRSFLPETVFRKRKQGFAIPKDVWFKKQLRQEAGEILLDRRGISRNYFNERILRRILGEHAKGRRDYSGWIWCLLILEMWHRTFIDADTRRV